MTRDNLLFTVIGLLMGFIGGYVMHEVMAGSQPARLAAGASAGPGQAGAGASGGGSAAAGQASSGAPGMEAVQELRQRVADNPEDTVALRQLAGMNYNIQNWSRAIELYRRYLELEPDDADAKTDLGACLLASGKPTEALELFRQVRQAFPNHWQARYNELLVLIFNLEDYEAADVAMKELQAMLPGNQDVERLAEELARRRQGA